MKKPSFTQPTAIDDVTLALPANVVGVLMPAYHDIPASFHDEYGVGDPVAKKWLKFQSDWFYHGITADGLHPREGIDKKTALRHLGAIQGSFEPKHEYKRAAVAYLASLWFIDDSTWEAVR